MTATTLPILTLSWLPLLVGLQSIPGTGALRTLMLLLGLAHILWWQKRLPSLPDLPQGELAGGAFLALTAWLFLQSVCISPQTESSLIRWTEEWLKLLLMGLVGINIARLHVSAPHWLTVSLFAGAFLHVLSTLGLQGLSFLRGGGPIYGESLLGNYGYASPFTTTALAWLLADVVSRIWHAKRLFPWAAWISVLLILLTLAAETFLRAKAAQVMIALLICFVSAALVSHGKVRQKFVLWAAPLLVFGAAAVFYAGSERWQGAVEAIWLAWHAPLQTPTGSPDADSAVHAGGQSFYLRLVWARVGLEGIVDHPLGLGYGTDAFGRYVLERFGVPGFISSHSGWIDFALANGIVGLALFLLWALILVRQGWQAFVAGNPAGAALSLLVIHFVGRALIDGHLAGSRLTGFALVAGALWAMSHVQQHASRPD